jgi:triphosphoribosyl-dephospho-CoA synthase
MINAHPVIDDTPARLERLLQTACILEATARKPGNVHPGHSFPDLKYQDFIDSAHAVAPILAKTVELGVGQAIRDAVAATCECVGSNANLGIILLLVPLAAVPPPTPLIDGIGAVLADLTVRDAELAYDAIRLAHPGGMGEVPDQDIRSTPTQSLLDVMRLAADRDLIARQYATNYSLVLGTGLPYLAQFREDFEQSWESAIVGLQLVLLSQNPDSLILRKCGSEVAQEASLRAQAVLRNTPRETLTDQSALHDFDTWLRADGHRRNPGTTADLIAASLFAAFRDGGVAVPDNVQQSASG